MSGSESQYYSIFRPFCDAIIRVDGVEFHVHRIVFCNCSNYFEALFLRHSAHERKVYEIPGVSADTMKLIVDFAYTGSMHVTENNVQELFEAADQFNIIAILQVCCNFLMEKLSPENCIGIWQFTKIFFSPELKHRAWNFILNHFEKVVSCEEFLMLTVQELTYILDRDQLNVRQESTMYEAIKKWINHAPEERNTHFTILLSKVRLALTSLDFLETVKKDEKWFTNTECLGVISHAIDIKHRMSSSSPPLSFCADTVARPRQPHALLLAFGGWSIMGQTNAIEAYDSHMNQWNNVTDRREITRAYHGSVFYHNSVYCVGGLYKGAPSSIMRRFDLRTRTWNDAAPMHQRRCFVSVTGLNGYIYAIGGRDGPRRHRTAERYDPKTNQWTYIAPMHVIRSDSSCTVLNNKIYMCGGFDGLQCLATCEYYTPETNRWTRFTSMRIQRSGLGIIAYEHQIFAVGGFDGLRSLNSIEAYNPLTNTWHAVAPMRYSRNNFGIEVMENKIFVVGGYRNFSTINQVEYYDPIRHRWHIVSAMGISRSAVSCCVVSELPNIAEYIISRDTLPQLDEMEGTVETEDAH